MTTYWNLRAIGAIAASLALAASITESARAQFNGDPFDPYRAAYRSSSRPSDLRGVPGAPRIVTPPGLGTVPGIGDAGATPFSLYEFEASRFREPDRFGLESLQVPGALGDDAGFGAYRPNMENDLTYQDLQNYRDELYRRAQETEDPEARAEAIREYRRISRMISLGLSSSEISRQLQERILGSATAPDPFENRSRQAPPLDPSADQAGVQSYTELLEVCRRLDRAALQRGGSTPAPRP